MIATIIPTCLVGDSTVECILQICNQITKGNICIISINPTVDGKERIKQLEKSIPDNCFINICSDKQESYGYAVDAGISFLKSSGNYNELVNIIICNDDVVVSTGFDEKLCAGFSEQEGHVFIGDVAVEKNCLKIGFCTPYSNYCIGDGMIDISDVSFGVEFSFASKRNLFMDKIESSKLTPFHKKVDVFSGFCFAISKACYEDIAIDGKLFDEIFHANGGGSEDRDLNARLINKGYYGVLSNCFVYHFGNQTKKITNQNDIFSTKNDLLFASKWSKNVKLNSKTIMSVIATFKTDMDIICFFKSIAHNSRLFDGLYVVFSDDIFGCVQGLDNHSLDTIRSHIGPELFGLVYGKTIKNQKIAIEVILKKLCVSEGEFLIGHEICKVFDFKVLRNKANHGAEKLGADWVFHIEQDEIIEQRVTKKHIEDLTRHPNPLALCYNFTTITHWNTDLQYITNFPYGDEGSLYGTLNSNRMYKVVRESSIHDGYGIVSIHCSHIPYFSNITTRYCNIRLRKYGLLDIKERWNKYGFYKSVDENPRKEIVGFSNYNHIIMEEGANISLYSMFNGCDMHMLFYSKEKESYIINWLDKMYGFCDTINLTWTDDVEINQELKHVIDSYNTILHYVSYSENKNLADCRNLSIEETSKTCVERSVGWNIVFDPDELMEQECLDSIRSMMNSTFNIGFQFKFLNSVLDKNGKEDYGISSNVRLFRSVSPKPIKFSGKIHETVSMSLLENKKAGIDVNIGTAPFKITNQSSFDHNNKIKSYALSLIESLKENPLNPEHWYALASQCGQDNRLADKLTCLQNAIRCEQEFGLHAGPSVYFECFIHYMKMAKAFMPKSKTIFGKNYNEVLNLMDKYAIEQLIVKAEPFDYEIPEFKT